MKAALLPLSLVVLAACVPAAKAPTAPAPPPAPVARPAPAPATAPTAVPSIRQEPATTDWMDAPVMPGSWSYRRKATSSIAAFSLANASGGLALTCAFGSGTIELMTFAIAENPVVRIRTETADAMFTAIQGGGSADRLVFIPASDPLLDAMALSKGRFAVEVEGLPPLYLPSHAEVSRVIEDCRG